MSSGNDSWQVYMVRCRDGTLYTGIARDLVRRIAEHNSSGLGARYTRSRRPVELVYVEAVDSRAAAAQREYQLKRLSPAAKRALIAAAACQNTAPE